MFLKIRLGLALLLLGGMHSPAMAAYQDDVDALSPTHYWTFDNTLNDRGLGITANGTFEGTAAFGSPITADSTNSLQSNTGQVGVPNTTDMNDGSNRYQTRTFATWFQADDLSNPSVVWEEGAGVNNFAISVGVARNVAVQAADAGAYYLTRFADNLIEEGKPYHVAFTWERGTTTGGAGTRLRMWLNGVEQGTEYVITDPNTDAFPSHTGDIVFGNTDESLKFYNESTLNYVDLDKRLAHFAIWNDVLLSNVQIQTLFENGASQVNSTLTLEAVPADTSISLHEVTGLGGTLVSETTSLVRDAGGEVVLTYPVTTTVPSRLRLVKYGELTYEGDIILDRFLNEAAFFLVTDTNISESDSAVVNAYTEIETLDKFYDRSRLYDEDTPANGFDLLSIDGSSLDLKGYNLVIDATAGSAFSVDTGTSTITVRASSIDGTSKFERIKTTGTITRVNGATLGSAILEDSTGITGRLTLTGLDTANVLIYDDASVGDDTISYQTSQSGTIAIPFSPTSSTDYQVVVRRQGYSEANFSFDPSSGGVFEFPINQNRALTIEGTPIYQNGGDLAKITMDYAGKKINIGDFTIGAQELYDTLQDYEVTEVAMKNPRISNYDGDDKVLLLAGYQFRNRDGGATVPGVSAFVFAETGGVLDNSNGSVQFLTNDSATVDRQEQLIEMLEAIQGSSWDNDSKVFGTPEAHLVNVVGVGFDPATDSLSNLVQSMLDTGILDINTIKDLLE